MPSATTRRLAAHQRRPEPSTPEQLAASILVVLAGIERHPPDAPAALAFRSALRRKGQDLAEAGGPAALADMLAWIRAADPDRADARAAVITAAWAGLADPQSREENRHGRRDHPAEEPTWLDGEGPHLW